MDGRRRLPGALDGDALDAAIGAYLAEHDHTNVGATGPTSRPAIAMEGKALSNSAHRKQRHRHLLSAVTHGLTNPAQREAEANTKETAAFRPLLEPPWAPPRRSPMAATRAPDW